MRGFPRTADNFYRNFSRANPRQRAFSMRLLEGQGVRRASTATGYME